MNGGSPIRTPDQRLRVFISSTLGELAEERAAVREAVERLQLTPVLFELGARPHPPRNLYRAYLEQSHIFVGVYWQRYGWVAPGETVSGLEDEYSLSEGFPRLLYVKKPAPDREPRLDQLLRRIQADDTASYKPFGTPEELTQLVSADLALLLSERFVTLGPPTGGPPPRAVDRRRHNLPVQLSSFVGRKRELADVQRALAESRLVTLTGVGGSGKSRLAIQAAADLVGQWPDGAWLVELAPLARPDRVAAAVATVLGIAEDPVRPLIETLADDLRSKKTLVVLDNCEHVLAPCAELAAAVLQAAPGLRVLATSREALAVPGEAVIPVQSLEVPPEGVDVPELAGYAAARLFAERARAVRPDFTVTPADAAAVVQIVRRLDGIPLALELAAARVKVLSVEQIAARLSDRFRLLSGGARTALPRQQTLRAAMDWSHDLLDAAERTLLRRLSVFPASWTIDAAEAVCGGNGIETDDVLDLIGRLVDKSLVVVVPGPEENRYRLLETVRQYGQERLTEAGETDGTRTAHRDWCRSIVEAAEVHVWGGRDQGRWLSRLESSDDDVHAALEWSGRQGDATASLRIAVGAAWFWYLHGHWDEARGSLEQSIALDGAEPALRAKATAWAAVFAWRRGDLTRAEERADASLRTLAGSDDEAEGLGLLVLGLVAISRHQHAAAEEYGRRALDVFRAREHAWGVTTSLLVLSRIAINRRSGEVDALLKESAALVASGGDLWGRVHVLTLEGYEAFRALDLDLAHELHSAGHALAVELGDRAAQAENLLALGHVHMLRGEHDEGGKVVERARSLVEQLQDPHDLGHADQGLALLAVSRGEIGKGQALLDDVARRFIELGRASMGSTYALNLADVYRRGGRPMLAAALLRHALSLMDENRASDRYADARRQLADLEGAAADPSAHPG